MHSLLDLELAHQLNHDRFAAAAGRRAPRTKRPSWIARRSKKSTPAATVDCTA
jgi:hypothetical protein